jgi:phosphatidylinositol-bisphosphatase
VRRSVEILNIGQVICQFRLIPKITSGMICKPWIRPRPSHGIILPGQSATLDFFFLADPLATAAFQLGDDTVEDIVVVHVEGGKDHFVSISGSFRPTPFCRPLAAISETVVTEDPLTGQLKSVRKVPIPVWKLVDFLYQYGGITADGLFLTSGYEAELARLQDALDLDLPIEPALATEAGFLSAGELLLRFLDCLPDSVVPSDLYYGAIAVCEDYAAAKELVSTMPIASIVLFEYLAAFLQYLVRKNRSFTRMDIAYVFAPILVKPRLDRGLDVQSVVSTQELRKQVLFLLLFL